MIQSNKPIPNKEKERKTSLNDLDLKKLSQKLKEKDKDKRDSDETTTSLKRKSKSNRDKKLKGTLKPRKEDSRKDLKDGKDVKDGKEFNVKEYYEMLSQQPQDKRLIMVDEDNNPELVVFKEGMTLEEFITDVEEEFSRGSVEKLLLGDKLVLQDKHMKLLKDLDCVKVIFSSKKSQSTNNIRPEMLTTL